MQPSGLGSRLLLITSVVKVNSYLTHISSAVIKYGQDSMCSLEAAVNVHRTQCCKED